MVTPVFIQESENEDFATHGDIGTPMGASPLGDHCLHCHYFMAIELRAVLTRLTTLSGAFAAKIDFSLISKRDRPVS